MRREQIGCAALYLGDCREVILDSLISWDTVISDPPYGIGWQSHRRKQKLRKLLGDESARELEFCCQIPAPFARYVFCRWDKAPWHLSPAQVITWVKNNHGAGNLALHGVMTEQILFWPGISHRFPRKRPRDVIYSGRTSNVEHPTEKPVHLMRKVCSWTEGVVFDPYMGSGSTGVACAIDGRKFVGVEIDEEYFDIACERITAAYSQMRLAL